MVQHGLLTVAALFRRHPKAAVSSLGALLLGSALTAFGLAPLVPDAADLPVRQIQELVTSLPTAPQAQALDEFRFKLFRSEVTRSSDTVDALFRRLSIDDTAAAAFLRSDAQAQKILLGRPGKKVTVETTDVQQLLKLVVRWPAEDETRFMRLVVERTPDGHFVSQLQSELYVASTHLASGGIRSSLFAATDDAGVPDAVAVQIAEIFSGDIDFHRALRKGDRFSVVYETLQADGEPLRTGKVLSAEFVNDGKTHQAMWFEAPGQKGGYYTLDGQSLRRAFLASPLAFSRITSGFAMRFHPILQRWRAHLGVDYAASTGTAVRAVGDGVIEFAGVQGGYGNVVMVRHRNQYTTVYAHLSRINVRRGQSVQQGQNIGAVGATGWATGPHLHFEFRVNGVHQDPMTLAKQNETIPLPRTAMAAFRQLATDVRRDLLAAAGTLQPSAQ